MEHVFPFLAEFMIRVIRLLCLPHSSAATERVFSAANRIKTKTRNRPSTRTIAGLLHPRCLLTDSKYYEYDVKVSDSLIKRMTSKVNTSLQVMMRKNKVKILCRYAQRIDDHYL